MHSHKPVIYLVDDDPSILKAISRTLRLNGLEVEAYESATGFLEHYANKPGCLILDLSMPEMNGLELQAELARRQIDIPMIFITGHGGVPESVQAIRAGAIDFLEKPFLPDTLLQRVDEALAQDHKKRNYNNERDAVRERFSRLTGRERDVFRLLTENPVAPSSKEMAKTLDISHRTVEHHRARILEKTHTSSAPELRALIQEYAIQLDNS